MRKTQVPGLSSLVSNAVDFIIEASATARLANEPDENGDYAPDQRGLKYAVLHLSAGIELLMKARLQKEHWSLLFDHPGKATLDALKSGSFRSASAPDLVERLKELAGLELGDDFEEAFSRLRKFRNRLEHFHLDENPIAISSVVSELSSWTFDFIEDELRDLVDGDEFDWFRQQIWQDAKYIEARLQSILPEIEDRVRAGMAILPCFCCLQAAVWYDGTHASCLFCRVDFVEEDLNGERWCAEWEGNAGSESSLLALPRDCPKCGVRLVHVGGLVSVRDTWMADWVCFGCGHHEEPAVQSEDSRSS